MRRWLGLLLPLIFVLVPSTRPRCAEDEEKADVQVVVTATRLEDRPATTAEIPASITVVDREAIERSGARTIQDLLSEEAGVILYDQVGNDVEKTFDLRGFSGGRGVAVFLDGNNEIAPPRQSGEAGRVLNEALLAERFNRRSMYVAICIGSVAGPTLRISRAALSSRMMKSVGPRSGMGAPASSTTETVIERSIACATSREPGTGEARRTATTARPAKSNFLPVIHSV